MKKEIEDLQKEIKYINLKNLKIEITKNFKISLRSIQCIAPYVLTAGITAGAFKMAGGGFPFYYGDTFQKNSHKMKEIDNLGNIRTEQQYDAFENSGNTLYYYSPWQLENDNLYKRNIEIYELKDITEEDILNILQKEELKLSDIFGDPISKKKETKNKISDEELAKNAYFQAVIYSEDENDYIICQETAEENIGTTILYIFMTFFLELIPLFIRSDISKFNFDECVSEIKAKYQQINVEDLKRKLEIKMENYNRLTR